jgi:hypothetical protein
MLATLEQFKLRYGMTASGEDDVVTQILAGVSAQLASVAGRTCSGSPCLEKTALTVLFSPDPLLEALFLPAWPVISVASVKEAFSEAFSEAVALVDKTDYQVNRRSGILWRVGGPWLAGVNTVEIVYIGGYTPAGSTPGTGETILPADLTDACLQQAGFVFQRRKSVGLSGVSAGGGSISSYAQDELLPGVRQAAESYRRLG